MPQKACPPTLKERSLKEVSMNIELLSYGIPKGSKELAKCIHDENYLSVKGPFVDWPTSLLEELTAQIYRSRSGLKHILHLIIQPHMTRFTLKLTGKPHNH